LYQVVDKLPTINPFSNIFMRNPILRTAILLAGLLPVASTAFAQTTGATYNGTWFSASIGTVPNNGLSYSHSYLGLNMRPGTAANTWTLGTDGSHNGGAMVLGSINGDLTFITVPNANTSAAQTLSDGQVVDQRRMQILASGQVRIGLTQPTSQPNYKLAVAGQIVAQSLYITAPNTWADFVFAPTYQPMSLAKLETYLQLNKHLPSVPSASEVEANGYSVTDMDAKLLQSVEELTLHVIELSKQNAQLTTRLAEVEKQLAATK
jgi:hypothetical protein